MIEHDALSLFRHLASSRLHIGAIAPFLALSAASNVGSAQVIAAFLDALMERRSDSLLFSLIALWLLLAMLGELGRGLAAYIAEDVKWRATNSLRRDLLLKVLQRSSQAESTGTILERIDGDVEGFSNFFSLFIPQVGGSILLMGGIIGACFIADWRLGTVFFIYSILTSLILVFLAQTGVVPKKEELAANGEVFGSIEEALFAFEELKSNGADAYILSQIKRKIEEHAARFRRALQAACTLNGVSIFLFSLLQVIALASGSYLLSRGQMSIGGVYLLFQYSVMIERPLSQLAWQLREFQAVLGSARRVQELLKAPASVNTTAIRELPHSAHSIKFENVTFRYGATTALDDVSFYLPEGATLFILGKSGSGKSTLTNLVLRQMSLQEGSVHLSGLHISEVSETSLRKSVIGVTQSSALLQLTLRDNLTLFDSSLTDGALLDALESVGLSDWFSRLPHGLETILGSEAGVVSAGEQQLIALARILLREPGTVILDESMSALDLATSTKLNHVLKKVLSGRTGIIISHTLYSLSLADYVLILEDGKVREFGERVSLERMDNSWLRRLKAHDADSRVAA